MANKTIFALDPNVSLNKANDILHLWQPAASGEKDRKATIQTIIDLLDVNTSFSNVPYLDKANTFTAENVFIGDVNIGANPSPVYALEVYGISSIEAIRVTADNASGAALVFVENQSQSWNMQVNAAALFKIVDTTAGTDPFVIESGAPTNAQRIQAGGQVGWGRVPTNDFDMHRASTNIELLLNTDLVNGVSSLRFENDAQAWSWQLRGDVSDVFRIADITNGKVPFVVDPNSPTDSLHITPTGVVVGAITALSHFEVVGTAAIDGSAPVEIQIRDLQTSASWTAGATSTALNFYSNDASGSGVGVKSAIQSFTEFASGATFGLRFLVDDGTSLAVKLALQPSGSILVGVGTLEITDAKLQIGGTDGALLLSRLTTGERDALTPTNGMVLYNSTTNRLEAYENGSWVDL